MEPLSKQPALARAIAHPLAPQRRAVALLFFVNGALFASWVSRIPAVETSLGLSHGVLGVALLGMALGALVAMPLAGWLSSRFGSARVCQISAILYAAALPWLALAPNAAALMLCLFAFGATHGAMDVAMNAQAVAVEEGYGRPIMSSFHALFSAGGLAGATMGALIAGADIGRFAHFAGAAVLLGGATVFLAFPRLLQGDAAKAVNSEARPDGAARRGSRFPWPSRTLLGLGIIAFCVMMGEGAMADWSAVFLRRVAGAGDGLAAGGYAAFSISMAAGRFFGDGMSVRMGPVNLVRWSGALAASGLAIALTFHHPVASLAGFAAVGAGFATVVPQVFTAAGRASDQASGPALATVSTLGYLGFLIGPPLIGFAAQLFSLQNALGIIVLTSLLLVALAPGLRPRTGAQPISEDRHQRDKALAGSSLEELT